MAIRDQYPEGTVVVPVRPGGNFSFDEKTLSWLEGTVAISPQARLQLAKAECARRITAMASLAAQININAAVSIAAAKAASSRTAEDKGLLSAADDLATWIAAMRDSASKLATVESVDLQADENWPVCAEGVADLVSSF
jgi:hypothetical protein